MDHFSKPRHTTSTVEGCLTNVSFLCDDTIFISKCTKAFSEYKGPISNIDSNFMHLQNPDHPKFVKVIKKPRRNNGRRRRRQNGDGTCFESCIDVRVKGNDDSYYGIKVFQNGVLSIPGAQKSGYEDIRNPLEEIARLLSAVFNKNVEIKYLKPCMINYKYHILNKGHRTRQIDIYEAYKKFRQIEISNPLICINDLTTFLVNNEYSKEELYCFLASRKSSVKTIRVSLDELDELIMARDLGKAKKMINYIKDYMKYKAIISEETYKRIYKRYIEKIILEFEPILRSSVNNLIRHVSCNSDKDAYVMIEFRSPIQKKSGKGINFKLYDSGKINIGGAVSEESAMFMVEYLNNVLINTPGIIYYDDEESCTSDDSVENEGVENNI